MDSQSVVDFCDQILLITTKKHLNDLQVFIIKGIWDGKTYALIGQECNHSESRIRDVACHLWGILSHQLREPVNKSSFRSVIERHYQLQNKQVLHENNTNQFSFLMEASASQDFDQLLEDNTIFHNSEYLTLLRNWLSRPNTRVILISGFIGMGKSFFVSSVIHKSNFSFERVIWNDVRLTSVKSIIINTLYQNHNSIASSSEISLLEDFFEFLKKKRYLFILDHLESLFSSKVWAGHTESSLVNNFLEAILEANHNSCFIILSSEKTSALDFEISNLNGKYSLEFKNYGSLALPLLQSFDLDSEEDKIKLINLYDGNPRYIKSILNLIKLLFGGKISKFMSYQSLILTDVMISDLSILYQKLSKTEQLILAEFINYSEPVTLDQLYDRLESSLPYNHFFGGLQSLLRRYILRVSSEEESLIDILPVFSEFLKTY